ncbi:MAG: CZB domain-containing protein [Rhodospirillaceae bacterium]
MTIYRAESDHIIWKKKLAEIMVGHARLNPIELADHHSCRLGKWYDSLKDEAIKKHPAYAATLEPHAAVHAHGIEAARLYQAGDLEDAMNEIHKVADASKDAVRHLDDLINR